MADKTPEFIVRGRLVDPNGNDLGPAPTEEVEAAEEGETEGEAETEAKPKTTRKPAAKSE